MGGRGQLTHLGLPGCAGTQRVPSEDASATPARLLSPHPGSCAPTQTPVPHRLLCPHRICLPHRLLSPHRTHTHSVGSFPLGRLHQERVCRDSPPVQSTRLCVHERRMPTDFCRAPFLPGTTPAFVASLWLGTQNKEGAENAGPEEEPVEIHVSWRYSEVSAGAGRGLDGFVITTVTFS